MHTQPAALADDEFRRFGELIYRVAGIRIPPTKRVMVANRLRRRLRATGIARFSDYYDYLTSPRGAEEMQPFLDAITTNETYFFRDRHQYDWFGGNFLPVIARDRVLGRRPRRLRVWSAACSTGEEPYSLAMLIAARRPALFPGWSLALLGTDLSGAALAAAKRGLYEERSLRLVAPDQRRELFDHDPEGNHWAVKPEVRAMVTWRRHNLLRPIREDPFDCIFLKNVLIYFDAESKRAVIRNLLGAMAPGGYLVVGPTEGVFAMLDPLVKVKPWLYRRPGSDRGGPTRPAP